MRDKNMKSSRCKRICCFLLSYLVEYFGGAGIEHGAACDTEHFIGDDVHRLAVAGAAGDMHIVEHRIQSQRFS